MEVQTTNSEQKIIAAKAAIFGPDGKILVLRRHPEAERRPKQWDLVGGQIEPAETPFEGQWREIGEETGIEPDFMSPEPVYEDVTKKKDCKFFLAYAAMLQVRLDGSEHVKQRRMTIGEGIVRIESASQQRFLQHLQDNPGVLESFLAGVVVQQPNLAIAR